MLDDLIAQRAVQPDRKARRAGPVAGQPEDDRVVGRRSEGLADERHIANLVRGVDHGGVQIQRAPIAGDLAGMLELDAQVGHRLIALGERPLHLLAERIGQQVVAVEDRLAHLRQMVDGVRVVAIPGKARPERLLVQLEALGRRAAEHHRAQPAIADGQRLDPMPGLAGIP